MTGPTGPMTGPTRPTGPTRLRYRRPTFYIMIGVLAALGVSVVVNVGHKATTSDRASDLRGLVTQVKADLASCNASAADSFAAYREVVGGRADEAAAARKILSDDEPYCTPVANSDLYDLATLEVPGTLKAYDLQPAIAQLESWAYPNAAEAITDAGRLLSNVNDQGARQDLSVRLAHMAQLSQSAERAFTVAAADLHTAVTSLDLRAADGLGSGGL